MYLELTWFIFSNGFSFLLNSSGYTKLVEHYNTYVIQVYSCNTDLAKKLLVGLQKFML